MAIRSLIGISTLKNESSVLEITFLYRLSVSKKAGKQITTYNIITNMYLAHESMCLWGQLIQAMMEL